MAPSSYKATSRANVVMSQASSDALRVRVEAVIYQAAGINSYELKPVDAERLPDFSAGSHIDFHLPDGKIRQYSICSDETDNTRYVITVQRELNGRGGSKQLAEAARPGEEFFISAPRNNFPLAAEATKHLLLAGGIGITPFMSMIPVLQRRNEDFELHYCTRSSDRTAFLRDLRPFVESGQAKLHYDGGDPSKGLDVMALIQEQAPGTHVYFCGPGGFMAAIKEATADWPSENVHFEYFAVPDATVNTGDAGIVQDVFQVMIEGSDEKYDVPAGKSIVEALRENGIEIPTSCEAGLCKTCITRYVEGIPAHQDFILSDAERSEYLLPCCSRSKSSVLVLQL